MSLFQALLTLMSLFAMAVLQFSRLPLSLRVISIVCALAGLVTTRTGNRRGWIQKDHRHCGGCGYDLTGISSFPTTRCPECGADYAAVGVQTWFRRPGGRPLIVLGSAMQSIPIVILLAILLFLR